MSDENTIKRAIQTLAGAGSVDDIDILVGSAAVIHDDIEDEDYGTIEFQSFIGENYIMGVSLSATENNSKGQIRFPSVDSDVIVALLKDGNAYVVSYSHLDRIDNIVDKSHTVEAIGVENVDAETDYDEVDETGNKTSTKHTPESIVSTAINESGSNDLINKVELTPDSTVSTIEDNTASKSTTVTQSHTNIKLESEDASVEVKEGNVNIISPKITLGSGGVQKAVLGETLATVLKAFITQVGSIITTTAMGPQPILNKAAVDALQGQVDTILSNVNLLE